MDRQDIDALLIGALYGELTPADEARLTAHLESHPTDRGALDDMKTTRAALRDSRFFDLQLEPPQAVSALLLQEAHRRAPKRVVAADSDEKQGWFYRFTRYFMAHPAMAAAAMLVVVIGFAGIMYSKKGDQFAETQVAEENVSDDNANATAPAEIAQQAPTTPPALADKANDQAESDRYRADVDTARLEAQQNAFATEDRKAEESSRKLAAEKKQKAIVVERPALQPKDLDDNKRGKVATKSGAKADSGQDSLAFEGGVVGGASGATADGRASAGGGGVAAPGAVQPPPTATATTTKPAKPSPSRAAEPAPAPAPDNSLIAWAKAEHNRALTLAKNGDCRAAAKVAVSVQNRAPDYYSQFMGSDRGLKNCQSYIANERDAEAERSGKARAQKRLDADEASPAPTTK